MVIVFKRTRNEQSDFRLQRARNDQSDFRFQRTRNEQSDIPLQRTSSASASDAEKREKDVERRMRDKIDLRRR